MTPPIQGTSTAATAASATNDPDLLKVGEALRRAGIKARELARQTGTPCYVWQDGRVVNIGSPLRPATTSKA